MKSEATETGRAAGRVAVRYTGLWTIEADGVTVWTDASNQGEDYAQDLAREFERLPAAALDAEIERARRIEAHLAAFQTEAEAKRRRQAAAKAAAAWPPIHEHERAGKTVPCTLGTNCRKAR